MRRRGTTTAATTTTDGGHCAPVVVVSRCRSLNCNYVYKIPLTLLKNEGVFFSSARKGKNTSGFGPFFAIFFIFLHFSPNLYRLDIVYSISGSLPALVHELDRSSWSVPILACDKEMWMPLRSNHKVFKQIAANFAHQCAANDSLHVRRGHHSFRSLRLPCAPEGTLKNGWIATWHHPAVGCVRQQFHIDRLIIEFWNSGSRVWNSGSRVWNSGSRVLHIKLVFEHEGDDVDIRRFRLAGEAKEKLVLCKDMAKYLFGLEECFLQYKDEDLESIVVGSDQELEDAIAIQQVCGKKTTKLFVRSCSKNFLHFLGEILWCASQHGLQVAITDAIKKAREEYSDETTVGNEVEADCKQLDSTTKIKPKIRTVDASLIVGEKEGWAGEESKLAPGGKEALEHIRECKANDNIKFVCTTRSFNGIDLDVILHSLVSNKSFLAEIPNIVAKIQNQTRNGEMQKIIMEVIERNPELLEIDGLKELLTHLENLQEFLSCQWGQLNLFVKALTRGPRNGGVSKWWCQ
eukprot:jgi/Bigna1/91909/estExt_fgenesh1_pg.C_1290014